MKQFKDIINKYLASRLDIINDQWSISDREKELLTLEINGFKKLVEELTNENN